jgi:hypothetical protein
VSGTDTPNKAPTDPWFLEHAPLHPSRLHALGVMTVYWNQCELALFVLFSGVSGIEGNLAFALTHEMSDLAVMNRMKEVIALSGHSKDVNNVVLNALAAYDINRLNRNQLTHFLPMPTEKGITLWRQKGPTMNPQPFPHELKDIRRVVEDLAKCRDHLAELGRFLMLKEYGNLRRALPNKLPLPQRLWTPPPPAQSPPKPQR